MMCALCKRVDEFLEVLLKNSNLLIILRRPLLLRTHIGIKRCSVDSGVVPLSYIFMLYLNDSCL